MKSNMLNVIKGKLVGLTVCLVLGVVCLMNGGAVNAQTNVTLPPGVNDVVKLTKAGLGDEVILSQIKSAGINYSLSTDQLIFLAQSGVSQPVIKALIANNPAATTPSLVATPSAPVAPIPPVASAPPVPAAPSAPIVASPLTPPPGAPGIPPTYDSFHSQLSPYGNWVEEPGLGLCWRPTVASFDAGWRPYGDSGHWIYTDAGWSWESDYPWGGIAFHYGRWQRDAVGWFWVPGYDWAPAWVTWRHSDGYIGWAPLPPAAVFRAGVGLEFGGSVALDVDFGLAPDAFLFVDYGHFWEHNLHGYFLPRDRGDFYFHHSVIANGYRFDHGRFVVEGLGRDHVELWTHHDVRVEIGHDFRDRREVERRDFRDDRRDRR